jgi:hypothetical protein
VRRRLSLAVFAILTGSAVTAAAQSPSVQPIGVPETVFSYVSDACEQADYPDAPARAWHMADGWVSLLASHYVSRRAIGGSLDLVRHDCAIIYNSHWDTSQADYRYQEWLVAPYALDPPTTGHLRQSHRRKHNRLPDVGEVIAIVHSEWYGYLVDPACTEGASGWVNALGVAKSQNDGAVFSEDPTGYLLRYPATPWSNAFPCSDASMTRYGDFAGTNIIKVGTYFIRFFTYIGEPGAADADDQRECVMRSDDPSQGWEVWMGGDSWSSSPTAPCSGVPGLLDIATVVYSETLGEYAAASAPFMSPTVAFQFSRDLMTWSAPTNVSLGIGSYAYPSLLDPRSTSRNFETIGSAPYLYLTRFNDEISNRDLVRFPLAIR